MIAMRLSKILILLFCFGIFLRLVPIITGNTFFWFDQGLDSILVKLLVVDHRINLTSRYSGLAGVLMGPVYTWMLTIPFAISRGDPRSFTIFLSFLSLISAGASYVFVKKVAGLTAGLFACAWVLFAPFFVFNSTVASSPAPLTSLFIFYIICAYELFANNKTIFWIPLLFLCGLFFQFEIAFSLFLIPVTLTLFFIFRSKKLFNRNLVIGILLLALTFVPQLLFDFRHNFLITKGFLNIFSGSGNSLYSNQHPLFTRFVDRGWSFGDDFLRMALLFRNPFIVFPVFAAIIYGWFISKQKKLFKILITIIAVFYIGFSLYPGPIWDWYRAGLPIVYTLLFVIPFAVIWNKFKFSRIFIIILFLSIFYKAIDPPSIISQLQNKIIYNISSRKTQELILDYVYKSADGKPFSYFAYTPPVYDYVWQFDFWQYGQSKYGYLPKNWQMSIPLLGIGVQAVAPTNNEGLFYLIMEPNPERPWEREGWRKNKLGKIIETKYFPGDVIVEKRITNEQSEVYNN